MAITGNAQYQVAAAASPAQGNTAYSTWSIEITIRREWENVWLRAHPLLSLIKEGKTNWNKKGLRKGNMMLIPVMLGSSTTVADGVADASELTALTPEITEGFTDASYNIAHYHGAFWNRSSEINLINDERGGGFLEGKTIQKRDEFMNAIAGDLASTSGDSRTAVLGIQQAIATGNTVGGIAQGTDTDWASTVASSYGAFSIDLLDNAKHAVKNRNGKLDLFLFAYASSNDLFAKLKANIGQAQRIVDASFEAKYGFETIMYAGSRCVMDGRLTSGVICGMDTSTWFFCGDDRPTQREKIRLPGTGATEHYLEQYCGVGCSNPAKNYRATGVT